MKISKRMKSLLEKAFEAGANFAAASYENSDYASSPEEYIPSISFEEWFKSLFEVKTLYISFCGTIVVPSNEEELRKEYSLLHNEVEGLDGDERLVSAGFRNGLSYEAIDEKDSLTVYLARVNENIGHIVADCPAGNWVEETFVLLDEEGKPMKADTNTNPNPVRQLGS